MVTRTRFFLQKMHSDCRSSSSMLRTGAKLYLIRGAQSYLGVVPEDASIANRVFASFLARLPRECPDPQTSHPTSFDDALRRLAEIMHDPAICTRDPCSHGILLRPRRTGAIANADLRAGGCWACILPSGPEWATKAEIF
ncbi:hypothetical protein BGW80DRAFT_1401581 [Lactifluus volemus]|nr:hypothetical protein BGW80DRAFT_1401581 [Lactifluus volemus]